ncbi:MAG TPA: dihydrofolate reductase [Pirellulaceae bacterium]|nr:dihydrofolate reductase [Pirellulaceae bacterium]HMO90805.1 dihydrofolate reductase [Pirellulaceae bacterium]HMP68056.1 dihydrofolate reductase [Pirellulaceae bacterium]
MNQPEHFATSNLAAQFKLSIIVAVSENQVIGRQGEMPWHLSSDLQRFKQLTMGYPMIMGRKTFDSIGRCLPGRRSIVISRSIAAPPQNQVGISSESLQFVASFAQAVEACRATHDTAFVIGGGEIYQIALPLAQRVFLTRVHTTIADGDTFFPDLDPQVWRLVHAAAHQADAKNNYSFTFEEYIATGNRS